MYVSFNFDYLLVPCGLLYFESIYVVKRSLIESSSDDVYSLLLVSCNSSSSNIFVFINVLYIASMDSSFCNLPIDSSSDDMDRLLLVSYNSSSSNTSVFMNVWYMASMDPFDFKSIIFSSVSSWISSIDLLSSKSLITVDIFVFMHGLQKFLSSSSSSDS